MFFLGTTALIALLRRNELVVANVGDSRGVLCDQHGNAVPLSSDHKPHIVSRANCSFSVCTNYLCVVVLTFNSVHELFEPNFIININALLK